MKWYRKKWLRVTAVCLVTVLVVSEFVIHYTAQQEIQTDFGPETLLDAQIQEVLKDPMKVLEAFKDAKRQLQDKQQKLLDACNKAEKLIKEEKYEEAIEPVDYLLKEMELTEEEKIQMKMTRTALCFSAGRFDEAMEGCTELINLDRIDNINSSNGTGDVTIRVDGNLKDVPGKAPAVKAKRADLSAADGDIGTTDNPFSVSVSEVKASADNVYLENDRDLIVDEIHGKKEDGTVQIRVDGDLTGKTADSIISGGHLEAEINGSLGTPENRMNTDVDSIKAKADDIYLNNISDKMEIRGMTAENIDIIARGDIFGKAVRSGNLVIRSNGHTGYSDNPLLIHVSGNVDIGSAYGEVHYVNSYRAEKPSEEK
uniref:Uncharacterized protein n=1 Tax=Glossina morsitans morsitans TaxID=37546 RepID=A0A1B0FD87_GLOMM